MTPERKHQEYVEYLKLKEESFFFKVEKVITCIECYESSS